MKLSWPNIVGWLFACIEVLALTGCATIFNFSKDMDVRFETEPQGGRIELDGGAGECAEAPCTLNLSKRRSYAVKASKDGYEDTTQLLRSRITKWTWVNFAWLYPPFIAVAFGIDFATQSFWVLERKRVLIRLKKPEEDEDEEEDEPEPEQPLPPCAPLAETPAVRVVKERFTQEFIDEQLTFYRGDLSEEEACLTRNQVWANLARMYEMGERLDVDEAFRREYFQRQGEMPVR